MKLKLSQLRKIIKEVVESEMGVQPVSSPDPTLLKKLEDEAFRAFGLSWKDQELRRESDLAIYKLIAQLKDQGMTEQDLSDLNDRVMQKVSSDPYKKGLAGTSRLNRFLKYFKVISSRPMGPFEIPSFID